MPTPPTPVSAAVRDQILGFRNQIKSIHASGTSQTISVKKDLANLAAQLPPSEKKKLKSRDSDFWISPQSSNKGTFSNSGPSARQEIDLSKITSNPDLGVQLEPHITGDYIFLGDPTKGSLRLNFDTRPRDVVQLRAGKVLGRFFTGFVLLSITVTDDDLRVDFTKTDADQWFEFPP